MKKFFICLAVFTICFLFICGNKLSAADDELQWSGIFAGESGNGLPYAEAIKFCGDFDDGHYDDWRLPTIDELRTLIKNCPATQTDGKCNIKDGIRDIIITNGECSGCGYPDNSGRFSKLGDIYELWSSSSVISTIYNDIEHWTVVFGTGSIHHSNAGQLLFRCVRNPSAELKWSKKAPQKMSRQDAISYCNNLKEHKRNDWRLPTIDELKTLSNLDGFNKLGDKMPLWSSSTSNVGFLANCSNIYPTTFPESMMLDVRCVANGNTNNNKDTNKNKEEECVTKKEVEASKLFFEAKQKMRKNPEEAKKLLQKTLNLANPECWTTYRKAKELLDNFDVALERRNANLMWSGKATETMNWKDAMNYCKNLKDKFNDWRLPNIDELRINIINHSGTVTGGSCKVSEKTGKIASSDSTPDDCNGRKGNNFSFITNNTSWLWSSSVLSDKSNAAWGVDFYSGGIYFDYLVNDRAVMCVRKINTEEKK